MQRSVTIPDAYGLRAQAACLRHAQAARTTPVTRKYHALMLSVFFKTVQKDSEVAIDTLMLGGALADC